MCTIICLSYAKINEWQSWIENHFNDLAPRIYLYLRDSAPLPPLTPRAPMCSFALVARTLYDTWSKWYFNGFEFRCAVKWNLWNCCRRHDIFSFAWILHKSGCSSMVATSFVTRRHTGSGDVTFRCRWHTIYKYNSQSFIECKIIAMKVLTEFTSNHNYLSASHRIAFRNIVVVHGVFRKWQVVEMVWRTRNEYM